jgi:hypothetical protein
MLRSVAIIVYSCLASASLDDFNPHQINAALVCTQAHPDICRADPPFVLENDMTLEQCQSQAMLQFMPGWTTEHPDRAWLGAKCENREP